MSHYTRLKTRIMNREHLVEALKEMGFRHVEAHDEPRHLYGYLGDRRMDTAHVIIRRKHVGRSSNDIGFLRGEDGSFTAIISGYDRTKYSEKWLDRLSFAYANLATREALAAQGFEIAEERREENGAVRLVMRRVV